ncbi:MAG: AAA family ATPase [Myxococcales bacterium]|jgi:type II secretory pathway predicted ATPase ExeA
MVTHKRVQPAPARVDLCAHFGLHHLPFTRELAVADRFRHPQYDELVDDLHQLVVNRLSAAVIAPAGTGKTVLLRCLRDTLPEARFRTHYMKVTDLSKRDFCREMAAALGAKTAGYYGALVRSIQDRCRNLTAAESLHPVLLIDECHDARPDVLSILRVIANFEMDSRLVVSMVLCGQTPLRAMLRRDALEDVSRRLARVATLRLLSRPETRDYIAHRLRLVGAQDDLLDPHAHEAIFEATQGNLRAVDGLTLRTLQLAAAAGAKVVDAQLVTSARAQVWP